MQVTQQRRRSRPAGKGRFMDALVLVSMALLAIALGTAAHLHGGLDVWTSVTTSVAIFACLLALHGIVRWRRAVDAMHSKISHLETEIERLGGDPRASRPKFAAKPAGSPPQFRRRGDSALGGGPEFGAADLSLPGLPPEPEPHRDNAVRPGAGHQFAARSPSLSTDMANPPPVRDAVRSPADATSRPGAGASKADVRSDSMATKSSKAARESKLQRAREGDVEMLQALIKKLADEVNAAEGAGASGYRFERSERAIGRSVDALKSAASSMREVDRSAHGAGANRDGRRAEMRAAPARDPEAQLQSIKDALVAGRVDVLLEPILTLKDRKPRHFEVSLRLKDENGNVLDVHGHPGTGPGRAILPIIDRVAVERSSQIALRLECRGRQGALFSNISGESLTADKFLDGVANAYRARESFAGQLVMTFSQADVRAFGDRERATLADLADLGFRYAIGSVTDLEMDFAALKEAGFDFVKLDADVFLDGLMTGETRVPARDICRYLADIGMTLIVGKIDDEQIAARIFGFGVLFGQGQMFGGPRPVKRSALETGKDHLAA